MVGEASLPSSLYILCIQLMFYVNPNTSEKLNVVIKMNCQCLPKFSRIVIPSSLK